MTREEAIKWIERIKEKYIHGGDEGFDDARRRALDMAIEALSADRPTDLINRWAAIDAICKEWCYVTYVNCPHADDGFRCDGCDDVEVIQLLPSADDVQGWIPVKWHEITDEEREREGYPKDWTVYIDCEMPYDEQEILIQTKNGYIRWDVCYEDGEFSLDSGWDWVEDILAWMPLPKPYKESEVEP